MGIFINGVDVSKPPFSARPNLVDIFRMRDELVDLEEVVDFCPDSHCDCGKFMQGDCGKFMQGDCGKFMQGDCGKFMQGEKATDDDKE